MFRIPIYIEEEKFLNQMYFFQVINNSNLIYEEV